MRSTGNEQRISVEKDKEAKAIMVQAQQEEFIHFAMDLEFLLRKKDKWKTVVKNIFVQTRGYYRECRKAEEKIEE